MELHSRFNLFVCSQILRGNNSTLDVHTWLPSGSLNTTVYPLLFLFDSTHRPVGSHTADGVREEAR